MNADTGGQLPREWELVVFKPPTTENKQKNIEALKKASEETESSDIRTFVEQIVNKAAEMRSGPDEAPSTRKSTLHQDLGQFVWIREKSDFEHGGVIGDPDDVSREVYREIYRAGYRDGFKDGLAERADTDNGS